MNVLVTGGAGFIGEATCRALEAANHDPIVFDRSAGGDILDEPALNDAVSQCGAVIHLAGVLGTHELFDTPHLAVDVNIHGTLNVLQACLAHGARYVGITMPQVFPSIYTATKIAATKLATAYHHTYGLPVSHVRAFNAYGPGQKHGEAHPQKIIPTFATFAWERRPIPVWGAGSQTVDLIHVDDLGHLLADALRFGDDEVFDGGTGIPLTVTQVAEMVNGYAGSDAGIEHLPMRRGETPTLLHAFGEGWELLDWKPEWDPDQLRETVDWYRP
jgi:UDP-glucose 4-epimerase